MPLPFRLASDSASRPAGEETMQVRAGPIIGPARAIRVVGMQGWSPSCIMIVMRIWVAPGPGPGGTCGPAGGSRRLTARTPNSKSPGWNVNYAGTRISMGWLLAGLRYWLPGVQKCKFLMAISLNSLQIRLLATFKYVRRIWNMFDEFGIWRILFCESGIGPLSMLTLRRRCSCTPTPTTEHVKMLCDCLHDDELFVFKYDSDAWIWRNSKRNVVSEASSASQLSMDGSKQFWY